MPKLNQLQMSKKLNISNTNLIKLRHSGKLEGCYEKTGTRVMYDEAKTRKAADENVQPSIKKKTGLPPGDFNSSKQKYDGLNEVKRQREEVLLQIDKIKLNEMKGTVVTREKVSLQAAELGATIREAVMAIPDRCSGVIAAKYGGDAFDCKQILQKECEHILTVCSQRIGEIQGI